MDRTQGGVSVNEAGRKGTQLAIDQTALPAVAATEEPRLGARLRDWIAILVMLSSAPSLGLIFTAMSPILPLIAAHFAAAGGAAIAVPALGLAIDGPLFAQFISTMPSVGLMLGGAPAGFAIDRFGARSVLLVAVVAFAFFGSAGLYVENAVLLLASRFALGFAAVTFGAATVWLIGARFEGPGRARALAYRNLAGGVGGFVSILLAGQAGEIGGWHATFGLYLLPLLVIPAALFAIPPTPPPRRGADKAVPTEFLVHLWPLYATVIALSVVMMMNTAQLSFLLADNGLTGPGAQSRVIVASSIMTMVGSLLYSVLGPRLGARLNYSMIAAALGFGVLATGLSHQAMWTRLGVGLTGFGVGYMVPHFARLVLDRAPAAARGRAVGLNFSSIYFGDFINPFIVRPITAAVGIHGAFMIVGGIVAATALQIVVPRQAKKDIRVTRARDAGTCTDPIGSGAGE